MLKLNGLTGFGGGGVTSIGAFANALFAWGDNSNGQGADGGTANPMLVPTDVNNSLNRIIKSDSFNDAQHMAFLQDDNLFTVGLNQYGQLCLGDEVDRDVFTDVLVNGSNITDVVCGGDHTLTIRNGKVNGCGRNKQDQLTGSQPNPTNTLTIIVNSSDIGGGDAVKVHASAYSSAVFTSNNEVYTWGRQIGAKTGDTNSTPVNILDFNETGVSLSTKTITDFAMGTYHALALTEDGFVFSMADSSQYGQAGNGAVSSSSQKTELVFGGSVSKIACGTQTSYAIIGGLLFGCGRGDQGELGAATSSTANSTFIELDPSITDWIDVQAGKGYVIAQRQDGTLYHSGVNDNAQQGNGATGSNNFGFVQIDGGTTAKSYTAYVAGRSTVYGLS